MDNVHVLFLKDFTSQKGYISNVNYFVSEYEFIDTLFSVV